MNIRRIAAVWAAKAAGFICKKMGRQGVTWAGKIALKIYPPVLRELASEVRRDIFVVCGTNGKTTTNNMLCAALEAEGQKVICNHTGSNMLNGVVAAFVLGAKLNGHMDADYACIEADEASTKYIFPEIRPDYMVMTKSFPGSAGPVWRNRYYHEHSGNYDKNSSGHEGNRQWRRCTFRISCHGQRQSMCILRNQPARYEK